MNRIEKVFGEDRHNLYVTGSSVIEEMLLQYGLCFKKNEVWIAPKNIWGELIKQQKEKLFSYKDIKSFEVKERFRRYEVSFELKNKNVTLTFQYGFFTVAKKKATINSILERLKPFNQNG